jgi:energy-coupling factor transporter ATP-binding protein EcfA2
MVWYSRYGWNSNPFELKPMPDLVSGFEDIRSGLLEFIKSGSCCLLLGRTGSGKTTLLKWLEKYSLEEGIPLYINTSGMRSEELEQLDIDKLIRDKRGLLGSMLKKDKKVIMLVDEAQTLPKILVKAIKRNLDNLEIKAVVLASPTDSLENLKPSLLGAFDKRIEMRSLKHDEALGMIEKRIGYKNPFEPGSLDPIFIRAEFVPRAILEACEAVAKDNAKETITKDFVISYFAGEDDKKETMLQGENFLSKLSPLQRKIVLVLRDKSSRPVEIATKLGKPAKTITSQLAYLGLKNRVGVMKRKGIEEPVVEKASEKPAVYKLTDRIKKVLSEE